MRREPVCEWLKALSVADRKSDHQSCGANVTTPSTADGALQQLVAQRGDALRAWRDLPPRDSPEAAALVTDRRNRDIAVAMIVASWPVYAFVRRMQKWTV